MPHNSWVGNLTQFGDKGVQVFFILSGFVIPYSLSSRPYVRSSAGRFLLRRFVRIQPAYVLAVLLCVFMYGFFIDRPDFLNPISFLANAFYVVPLTDFPWLLNVGWTLGVEAQFYLIIALAYPALTSEKPLIRRSSFIAFFAFCFCSPLLPSGVHPWYVLCMWTPFFGTGLLLFLFHVKHISIKEFGAFLTILLVVLFLEYTKLLTLITLSTALLILLFSRTTNKLPCLYLGKISYSLYLVHLPIITVIALPLHESGFTNQNPDITVLLLLAASVIAAIPFFHFVEKPSLAWSKKILS